MNIFPIMSLRKSWKWIKRFILLPGTEEVERKWTSYYFDDIMDDFYFLINKKSSFKDLKLRTNWNDLLLLWEKIWKYTEEDKIKFLKLFNIK